MFIKKTAPFAAVALIGALFLTGCTTATPDKEADKPASSETQQGEIKLNAEQQELVDAFKLSEDKMMKEGYTETASDGESNILISYDPATNRTVTLNPDGTATYIEGASGTAPQTIGSFIASQPTTVKKKDGKFTVTLPDAPDSSLIVTVKDGVVVSIVSEQKDAPSWEGKLVYKVTDEAKAAFEKATPVEAPPVEGEAPPVEQ